MVYHPTRKSKTRRDLLSGFVNIRSESMVPGFVVKTRLAWLRKLERKWKTWHTCAAKAKHIIKITFGNADTCPEMIDPIT